MGIDAYAIAEGTPDMIRFGVEWPELGPGKRGQ